MSDAGYVRLHRSLLGHVAFRNDGEAMAFAWMIARASWKTTRVRYKGQAVNLNRGQLAVSVRDLAETLDRPKGWVERLISRLKNETMIETRTETGVTVITICKYDEYQAEQDGDRTACETPKKTAAGQPQDTEQRREEHKKKEEDVSYETSSAPRGAAKVFPMPEGAKVEHWKDFLANRKRKRAANTATAHAKLLADLARLSDDEWPPGRLIEHAAAQGWAGIYDPRGTENRHGNRAHHDRYADEHRDPVARSFANGTLA